MSHEVFQLHVLPAGIGDALVLDYGTAGKGDGDPFHPELADERGEVDLLASQRAGLVVGEDPLDVPSGRDTEREGARSLFGPQPGGRVRQCRQRGDRAAQLVRDELQALGRDAAPDGAWLQLRPSSLDDGRALEPSTRRAAERTAGSGSPAYGLASPGSPAPLPSATSAFRLSHRGSFFGT